MADFLVSDLADPRTRGPTICSICGRRTTRTSIVIHGAEVSGTLASRVPGWIRAFSGVFEELCVCATCVVDMTSHLFRSQPYFDKPVDDDLAEFGRRCWREGPPDLWRDQDDRSREPRAQLRDPLGGLVMLPARAMEAMPSWSSAEVMVYLELVRFTQMEQYTDETRSTAGVLVERLSPRLALDEVTSALEQLQRRGVVLCAAESWQFAWIDYEPPEPPPGPQLRIIR